MNEKNYTIIENTPGYLPEEDDPPTFDSYAEAMRALVERNKELREEQVPFPTENGDSWEDCYEVDPIVDGCFHYRSRPVSDTTLDRVVCIEKVEDE